jgi:excisionase family DNA binding protein
METPHDLLTPDEAAKRRGVTHYSILKAIRAGRLPAEKQGGTWRIRLGDLDNWEPRPRGRPRGKGKAEPKRPFPVPMSEAQRAALHAEARREGVSAAELVRRRVFQEAKKP